MASFRKFEEIVAWQKARILAKCVYEVTADGGFSGISVFGIRYDGRLFRLWRISLRGMAGKLIVILGVMDKIVGNF